MGEIFEHLDAAAEHAGEGWRQACIANQRRQSVAEMLAGLAAALRGIETGHIHQELTRLTQAATDSNHQYTDAVAELGQVDSPNLFLDVAQSQLAEAGSAIGLDNGSSLGSTSMEISRDLGEVGAVLADLIDRVTFMELQARMAETEGNRGRDTGTQALAQIKTYKTMLSH